MFTTLALIAGLVSAPAEAGVYVNVAVPGVRVVIDPWAPGYRPGPRAGWRWVDGYWDAWGNWIPGYWVPGYARAGYTWVPGYWVGHSYVEGYWRPVDRYGYRWVDGYYSHGRWVAGYWAGAHAAAVRYDRVQEYREDRREYGHHEAYGSSHHDRDGYRRDDDRDDDRGDRSDDRGDRGDSGSSGHGSSSGGSGGSGHGSSSGGSGGSGHGSSSGGSGGSGSGGASREHGQADTRHQR